MTSSEPKVPLRKNPWFWAAIACLIFPPLVRPFTRNIVEAPLPTSPPVTAQLLGSTGLPFGNAQLEERIHITIFADAREPGCPEAVVALRPLVERMDIQALAGRGFLARTAGFGDDIRVLVVAGFSSSDSVSADLAALEASCSLDTNRWVVAGGELAEVLALGASFEGRSGQTTTFLSHRRMTIVDTQRRSRGLYGLDELGLDEVYHRARHVLRDDRIEAREAIGGS